MIKPHCSHCGSIYLNETCPCSQGMPPRRLLCECGKPAREILVDHLGEWPLCAECLALERDGLAPMPLPDFRDKPDLEGTEVEATMSEFTSSPSIIGDLPVRIGKLSEREYAVAKIAHQSYEEIANELYISVGTVKSHLKSILKKLGLQSRYEIRHVLHAYRFQLARSNCKTSDKSKVHPWSISITFSGKIREVHKALEQLEKLRNDVDAFSGN